MKKILNIQNEDVFELQDGNTYEEAVNVAIEDRDIPDVLVVKGRDNLLRLIEAGLIEELTETYEECTTDTIKEMYESYGDSLLQSATVDGKLYAFPNTVIDDGTPLLQTWLPVRIRLMEWMQLLYMPVQCHVTGSWIKMEM